MRAGSNCTATACGVPAQNELAVAGNVLLLRSARSPRTEFGVGILAAAVA